MNGFFRSVGAQLSLALLLVVAIALGIVYLTVVPSLRNRVVNTRIVQVKKIAAKLGNEVTNGAVLDPDFVAAASEQNDNARVALLNRLNSQALVEPWRDSSPVGSGSLEGDPVATSALDSGEARHGTVKKGDATYAEAAVPVLAGQYALLVRSPVELGTIRLVERRVLFAAGAALLVALLLGYVGARMFARRIRRLERAADRIASGRFDEPVADEGGGELGALAAAF